MLVVNLKLIELFYYYNVVLVKLFIWVVCLWKGQALIS